MPCLLILLSLHASLGYVPRAHPLPYGAQALRNEAQRSGDVRSWVLIDTKDGQGHQKHYDGINLACNADRQKAASIQTNKRHS